jgi:hypothetical protein
LEDDGLYIDACDAFAKSAFQEIVESDLSPNLHGGRSIGYLLRGMSCAIRGGDSRRARFLQGLVETCSRHVQTNVESEVYPQGHRGAAEEWIADSYFLLKSGEALDYYDRVETYFTEASDQGAVTWAMEAGHEEASIALLHFLEFEGYGVSGEDISRYDYEPRLATKRELLSALIGSQD